MKSSGDDLDGDESQEDLGAVTASWTYGSYGHREYTGIGAESWWRTPIESETLSEAAEESATLDEEPAVESEAELANTDRLKLLARKYALRSLSPEDAARLEIVTERVRYLIPRVTASDFEALERIHRELEEIGTETKQTRKDLELGD